MNRLLYLAITCGALSVACGDDGSGNNESSDARMETILALEGDASAAQADYMSVCAVCHDDDGSGSPAGDDLTSITLSDEVVVETILYGKGTMAPYENSFSDQQIADLTALVQNF
jgi:mono/diheme cytochrome c family protein